MQIKGSGLFLWEDMCFQQGFSALGFKHKVVLTEKTEFRTTAGLHQSDMLKI